MKEWIAQQAKQAKDRLESEQDQKDWLLYKERTIRAKAPDVWNFLRTLLLESVTEFNNLFPSGSQRIGRAIDDNSSPDSWSLELRKGLDRAIVEFDYGRQKLTLTIYKAEQVAPAKTVVIPLDVDIEGQVVFRENGGLLSMEDICKEVLKPLFPHPAI